MKNYILLIFRMITLVGYCLGMLLILNACSSPYPTTVYDVSNRRLSHYENNYFIRLLPKYTPFQSHQNVSPILIEQIQAISDDNGKFLFNKGDSTIVGFFRLERQIEPSFWFRMIDTTKKGEFPNFSNSLIEDTINQFDSIDLEPDKLKLNTYNNFLLIDTHTDSEKNRINLKLALKPYATFKGGSRNSLFIAFMFYLSSVSEDVAQKDFEILLENTVLSYFLNYERILNKKLSFN